MNYNLEDLEQEKNAVANAVAMARVFEEASRQISRQNRNLWIALATLAVLFILETAAFVSCVLYVQDNAQQMVNDAVLNALNSVAELGVTTETTTTTITQDTGEGSGNNVYQSGENATYEEAAD